MFNEKQRFTQWWLIIALLLATYLVIAGALEYYVPFLGEGNTSDHVFPKLLAIGLMLGVDLAFILARLDTSLNKDGLEFQFKPLVKRRYTWDEIESLEVKRYRFVGGWGIRAFTQYGTVYSIKGSQGMQVRLKNGKKFLIGTQKVDELKSYVEQHHADKLKS